MHKAVEEMSNEKTFMGYPPEYGHKWLLDAINENDYKARGVELDNSESLYQTVQRVTVVTLVTFFQLTTRLQFATLFTLFTLIQML